MNKQGIVFTRPRDTISFFVGLILFIFGLLPLLVSLGILKWGLPKFMTSLPFSIAIWIIAIAGLYVVIDGFIEPPAHNLHWFLIAAGIVLFLIGFLPILHNFGIIGLSFGFLNNLIVYYSVITLEGLLLIVGGLTEH
jgi:hypothetical protein